ncbi:MAG: cation:proton antiporter [Planctomycetaceae bacterium]|nr:cation:proton antiporter [Planctomycetaceae bacterium]
MKHFFMENTLAAEVVQLLRSPRCSPNSHESGYRNASQRCRNWVIIRLVVAASICLPLIDRAAADETPSEIRPQPAVAAPTDSSGIVAGAQETAHVGSADPMAAMAEEAESSHGDPIAPVLLGIVVILLVARAGGHLFETLGQPAVLGELVMGMVLGNLYLCGFTGLEFLKVDYTQHHDVDLLDHQLIAGTTVDHIARIGVILLLFQVGLESSVRQMLQVGLTALLVAIVGVVVPTALGWGCGAVLLPDHPWPVHMFLGATLCATSVGITARVLQDLGQSTTKEAHIILGAAVIDDVLGLVVLAVAQGVIATMAAAATGAVVHFGVADLGWIIVRALGFLVAALFLGQYIPPLIFRLASYLGGRDLLIVAALLICFSFAYAANAAGLATIVGAFAAGLILDDVHYQHMNRGDGPELSLDDLMRPLLNLFVPVFFVEMGLHVDLRSFANLNVLGLASVLTVAAIIGKQVCGLVVPDKDVDRLSIGLGMIPRGEVGLIFAAIGLQLKIGADRIIDEHTYSALVVMVIVTTMVTPPLLKWGLQRRQLQAGLEQHPPAA